MTNKIFRSTVFVAVLVLLCSLGIVVGVLYSHFTGVQVQQLKDELSLAVTGTEQYGNAFLENVEADRFRVTWIDIDGTVLFDTQVDQTAMENHADREEIREAFATGSGSAVRNSSTLTEQTYYEARKLQDGTVLRISANQASAWALMMDLMWPIVLIALLAIGLSALLARRMTRKIVEPLNKLNLEQPLSNDTYEELSPLLHRIHTQHQEIQYQLMTLKHKQKEFEQITGNMKEALVLLDGLGRIVSINPAAKELFGVKHHCVGEDFLTIDRKQDMRQAIQQAQEKGHAFFHGKKNGRDYQFDVSRIESAQDVHGTVILAFDITEQMNAEKHRQEFTANVSHELKTPLQSIIGSAELMEHGIVKEEDAPRFIGHIRREASRLVSLIDDIIRLSQLDEGTEMPRDEVSLRVLSEEVCETLSDAAKLKDISLEVSGDDGVMNGVRRLLYEVIYNLCDNAIKYNNPGGYVKVSIVELSDSVKVSVSDNGIGIPPEHQDKIFERFYRVDKSHSKQSGGTGLGLSIVKHAVQYHHGKVMLESEPGQGTTISVLFDTEHPTF